MKKPSLIVVLVLLVLIVDQAVKIWVKTNMEYGEDFQILGQSWALIHFVENNGMAFGMSLGGSYGKLLLSVFRVIAVGFLIYYLRMLLRSGANMGLMVSFALILAGALGNILDSAFYGLIFSESPYHGGLAEMFPEEGGYASFLHGKVVDMLYFPIINTYLPDWVPFWGGEHFLFFKPVFNIADTAISVGVFNILLFQRSFFHSEEEKGTEETDQLSPEAQAGTGTTSDPTPSAPPEAEPGGSPEKPDNQA